MKFFGPKSIKYHVDHFINKNAYRLKDKIVIDIPAGAGATSELLDRIGAQVKAFDLFPEFFTYNKISCKKADLAKKIPVDDHTSDYIFCQEGIEHMSDQLFVMKEFNRICKKGGKLIVTTPNYSNLKSRMSYMLTESEYSGKIMPPNELDSLWLSDNEKSDIYYGHIFLTGIQKLRVLGILSGFEIKTIHPTRINGTSLFLFPFWYPFIWLASTRTCYKAVRKNKDIPPDIRKKNYRNILKLMRNPKILLDGYLFIEYEKTAELPEIKDKLLFQNKALNKIT